MSKPLIIIADTNQEYLATLEKKFLEELNDQADLEIISDIEYFELMFRNPVTAEIVIVGQEWYSTNLQKHNIAHLFVLTENRETGNTEELAVTRVFKYLGIRELYNELTYQSMERLSNANKEEKVTQVIAFYSAIGGSGKTGLSVGLAKCLAEKHKRILYINTESIQDFSYYLEDKSGLSNDGYRAIKDDENNIYHNIRYYIRKESFAYLPPFMTTLDARNLDFGVYKKIISGAKKSGEYDFIIVDVEAGYSSGRIELLQIADKVMLVMLQDAVSTQKMQFITQCLDFGDREKYMIICNKYDEAKENAYFQSELQAQFSIKEYIELEQMPLTTAEQMARLSGIEKLSYMFI